MSQNKLPAHNEAKNRFHFTGKLTLIHALHIGNGRGDDTTDALVVSNTSGIPIIPGSSLRGVFRSETEKMLMGLYQQKFTKMWACQLYESDLPDEHFCVNNTVHKESREKATLLNKKNNDEVWNELRDDLCDACQLFGAGTFYASRLRFLDLELEGEHKKEIRHGVGIHRDTGTAAPGVKYDKQVVEAGAVFRFEALAENLEEKDCQLLALGFSQLTSGEMALGGSTGRGLGTFKLEGCVEWVDMTNKKHLLEYLKSQSYPTCKQNLNVFIRDGLDQLLK